MELTLNTRLDTVVDLALLQVRIAEGYIDVKAHRSGTLFILDYSRTAQFDQVWDAATMLCRGLMVTAGTNGGIDADSLIAARGFAKFFNLDQHEALADAGRADALPVGERFDVYTKEDGSFGIAYLALDGRPAISTRGSFYSDQALWATDYLRSHPDLEGAVAAMLSDGTPVFEIISPVSRIVKTYDFDDLIFLSLIDRATGSDIDAATQWPGRIVVRHDGLGDFRTLANLEWPNEEGFVIKFASGVRVKVKFAEYKRLHGLVTGMSTKKLWEHLSVADLRDAGVPAAQAMRQLGVRTDIVTDLYSRSGDPLADILNHTPDEFDAWVATQVEMLRTQAAAKKDYYAQLGAQLPVGVPRKDLADTIRALAPDRVDQGVLFSLADGRSILGAVWSSVRPAFAKAFTVDTDA